MSEIMEIDAALLASMPLPALDEESDKKDRGSVLILAGGRGVPGASILTGLATLRAGAGRLQVAATDALAIPLGIAMPEAQIARVSASASGEMASSAAHELHEQISKCEAVVLGPGMLDPDEAGALAHNVLKARTGGALVIDAAALTGLEQRNIDASLCGENVVLTPHAGELAKLMDCGMETIQQEPARAARETAARYGAVVVLKGADTFIADLSGAVLRHRGGVPGLGTSGSGDVLAGVIGGLLARGLEGREAAVWGVVAHAEAGARLSARIGALGFLARELLDEIPVILSPPTRG